MRKNTIDFINEVAVHGQVKELKHIASDNYQFCQMLAQNKIPCREQETLKPRTVEDVM